MKRIDGRDVLTLTLCVVSGMLGYVDGKYSGMAGQPQVIEVRPLREGDLFFDARPIVPSPPWLDGHRPERPAAPAPKQPPPDVEPLFLDPPKPQEPPSWLT